MADPTPPVNWPATPRGSISRGLNLGVKQSKLADSNVANSVIVHELMAENASLKARLNATPASCAIPGYLNRVKQAQRGHSTEGPTMLSLFASRDAETQTRVADKKLDLGCQTVELGDASEEVRKLKQEILRSHAENASLQHAVHQLRRAAMLSPLPQQGSSASPDGPKSTPTRGTTAENLDLVEVSHLQAMDKIEMLSEALKQSNEKLSYKEYETETLKAQLDEDRRKLALLITGTDSQQPRKVHKAAGTDEPLIDLDVPKTLLPGTEEGKTHQSQNAALRMHSKSRARN